MNRLQADITDKIVVISQDVFPGRSELRRLFHVIGGFGCQPHTMGSAIMGDFIANDERCRLDGRDVERLATDAEIREAVALKAKVTE